MPLSWGRSLSLSLSLYHVLKGFPSRGWCTRPSTAWPRSPSAATASSAQLCCSLSCFSLSSFPSHPVTGRWIRRWVPPCFCFTSFSWFSAWCWKIALLPVPFPSEQRPSLLQASSALISRIRTFNLYVQHVCLAWFFCRNCAEICTVRLRNIGNFFAVLYHISVICCQKRMGTFELGFFLRCFQVLLLIGFRLISRHQMWNPQNKHVYW